MKTDQYICDPVFQLNLLIWMAKEQPPDNYSVRPFFYEQDFKIVYIEQPFKFPVETITAIQNTGKNISIVPEPEIILGRQADGKALYFEAKANSFGKDSDNSRQARAHLLAVGPAFREVLAPLLSCLLCYVLPVNKDDGMNGCLKDLTDELKNDGLSPGAFSIHGLSMEDSSLVYSWDPSFKAHINITDDKITVLKIPDEETNPTPLLLVFSDEDCNNPDMRNFYREALLQQVRAILLCDLHSSPVGNQYQISADKILLKTTSGVFEFVGSVRQKNMCRLVRENIFKKIHKEWGDKQAGISLEGNLLSIQWQVSAEKEKFLKWLEDRRVVFDVSKPLTAIPPEERQLGLFDQSQKSGQESIP